MFDEFINSVSTVIKDDDIQEIAKNGAENLLTAIITKDPTSVLALAGNAKDLIFSLPNVIYADKMYRFLTGAFSNYKEQLKFAARFDKDDRKYKETVKKQLQIIEKIDFDEKINIFANLTRAVSLELLDIDIYLRLSIAITNILYDDLIFLKEIYDKENIEENSMLSNLYSYKLVDKHTPLMTGDTVFSLYNISNEGIEMLRCGIDLENYNHYKLMCNDETKI